MQAASRCSFPSSDLANQRAVAAVPDIEAIANAKRTLSLSTPDIRIDRDQDISANLIADGCGKIFRGNGSGNFPAAVARRKNFLSHLSNSSARGCGLHAAARQRKSQRATFHARPSPQLFGKKEAA